MRYRIFEFRDAPDQRNLDLVLDVLKNFDFPWRWVLRDTIRDTQDTIVICIFEEMRSGTRAIYDQTWNRIRIGPVHPLMSDGELHRLGQTLAHELAHLIDDACLTHAIRHEIHALMHEGSSVALEDCVSEGYWRKGPNHRDRPIEAFGNLGPHLWCPKYAKNMSGYGPHTFTRAEQIKDLVMGTAETNPPFSDVTGTAHEDAILWASEHGLVGGFPDGTFRPNEPVSRGQLASILHRLAQEGEAQD